MLDRFLRRRGQALTQAVAAASSRRRPTPACASCAGSLYAVIVRHRLRARARASSRGLNELAASLLASGAIAAAILGFAARQTLANFIAGIMLAVTQPIRVGDWVFVEDQYGVVEDIRLNYTFLRTLGDQQVVIPNEKLATGILRNDTLGDGVVGLDVAIWLPPTTDAAQGRRGAARGDGPDRVRWPRSPTSACGSRSAAIRARRPSARRARRSSGCAASRACARKACSRSRESRTGGRTTIDGRPS